MSCMKKDPCLLCAPLHPQHLPQGLECGRCWVNEPCQSSLALWKGVSVNIYLEAAPHRDSAPAPIPQWPSSQESELYELSSNSYLLYYLPGLPQQNATDWGISTTEPYFLSGGGCLHSWLPVRPLLGLQRATLLWPLHEVISLCVLISFSIRSPFWLD